MREERKAICFYCYYFPFAVILNTVKNLIVNKFFKTIV